MSSPYLLEESLLIGEVGGAKPESADGKAESLGTGECPPPTYLKSPCSLERSTEPNQSLQMARLNPPGQESVLPLAVVMLCFTQGLEEKKVGSEHRGKSQWTADKCVKFLILEAAESAYKGKH